MSYYQLLVFFFLKIQKLNTIFVYNKPIRTFVNKKTPIHLSMIE